MAYMECLGYVPSLAAFPKAKNQSHDVGVSELRGGFCDTTFGPEVVEVKASPTLGDGPS